MKQLPDLTTSEKASEFPSLIFPWLLPGSGKRGMGGEVDSFREEVYYGWTLRLSPSGQKERRGKLPTEAWK